MRIMSIITAIIVAGVLYALVLQRDALMAFTGQEAPPAETNAEPAADVAATEGDDLAPGTVRVMARHSIAQPVDSAVFLRGETQALRQVEVRAETSGKVVSDPLRKGAQVTEGQLLCELDPGTRAVTRREAEARLASAKALLPESRARLAEAHAQIPAAEAGILQARAAVPAAEAALLEAQARVPQAEAALEEARARLPESESRVTEAEARVREAEINLTAAKSLAQSGFAAQTRLAGAEATYESAKAQIQTAQTGLKSAAAGVESALSALEGAKAGVQSALSNVEGAKANVATAQSRLESAQAGVQAAMTGEESATASIQSAEAAIAAADKDIERLAIRAPFGGLLETDTAELGALMQPGSACATVIQLDPVKIVAYVPETSVGRLDLDARAGARLVDGREITGTVSFISRSADPATRTFRVELEVANPDLAIRDGQTADIAIEAEGTKGHLVPQSALTLDDEGELGVRTVAADLTALFVPVTVLRDTRQGIWVGGLPDTADIIILGQEYVTDGVALAPSYEEVIQ